MTGSVDRERRIAAIEARLKNAPVCSEHALESDFPIACVVCGAPAHYWTPKDEPAKPGDSPPPK